jgi:hypothetical protein
MAHNALVIATCRRPSQTTSRARPSAVPWALLLLPILLAPAQYGQDVGLSLVERCSAGSRKDEAMRSECIVTEIHDFAAPDFFKTIDLREPAVMRSSGIGIPVDSHQQRYVEFIARMPGHFGLICADHDWVGMTAEILVE